MSDFQPPDLDSSRMDDDNANIYERYKDNLERCRLVMEREGVNATMLYAWCLAHDYKQRLVEEQEEHDASVMRGEVEPAVVTLADVLEGDWDACRDEARDHVEAEFEEVRAAMDAMYGEEFLAGGNT